MKVAVTGSTGFIGSHLVPALLRSDHEVTSIVEPGMEKAVSGTKMFEADISAAAGISEAFAGADSVVHLAARNHVLKETARDPLAEYRRVNVEGTRNVVRAASSSGVKCFVHLSSVKAMGEESKNILDEESPCAPKTPYGISKLESEEVVRAEATRTGMRAVILRLPMAYGPRNKGNLPRMIRWADRGFPFPLFQPDNLRSMVYVENVVAGIMAVLKNPPAGVSTCIVKDKEDCSTRAVYSAICRELGKTPRFLSIPELAVRLGGVLSEDFQKVAGSFRVSSARFEKEFGFTPPHSLEEGIARTVRWYLDSAH
ncbi:MAG: NAD-dependent epimerase/dehydratase family protein [Deltaproteobacteria bacterium]|nr:NAD-dependent epimerase/dehydratase family protein [Deltaproteobacteria bacterium]